MNTSQILERSSRSFVLLSVVIIAGACWSYGPLGPLSGGRLSGNVVEGQVGDWAFVDDVKIVQLETNPDDPYSVNIWLTRTGDEVYIFQASDESTWVQNVGEDARVRLRIAGQIYERRVVIVKSLETKREFLDAMRTKYEGDMGFDPEFWQHGWDTGEFLLFRMGFEKN